MAKEVPKAVRKMELARHRERPNIRDYISLIFEDFFELHGDRAFGDDNAIVGGIARFRGEPVTVIGHVKGKNLKENIVANFGMAHPEGYRKALRLMKQAEKFARPVICLVDTSGAYCGIGAEERGQGEAIARNLMEMMGLTIPVITVITGEGGSGGALGLGVANRVYMLENAVYSVISPKGFASILWKDASREAEAATMVKMTAEDLLSFGVIDGIILEPADGAHKNARAAAEAMASAIDCALFELSGEADLSGSRYQKYRAMGQFGRQT